MIRELYSLKSDRWRVSEAHIPTEFVRTAVGALGNILANELLYELEGGGFYKRDNRCIGQLLTNHQFSSFVTVSEQPIMPDFHKPVRQNMNHKPADEFAGRKGHDLPFVAVFVIPPLETDLVIFGR